MAICENSKKKGTQFVNKRKRWQFVKKRKKAAIREKDENGEAFAQNHGSDSMPSGETVSLNLKQRSFDQLATERLQVF